MTYFISEVLRIINRTQKRTDKVEALQKHKSKALLDILQLNFNPSIKFIFIDKPKYNKCAAPGPDLAPNHLFKTHRYLHRFVLPQAEQEKPETLKKLLTVVLESMHSDESEIFFDVIKKRLKVKGLTITIINEAFPGFLPEPPTKKPKVASKSKTKSKPVKKEPET